MSLQEDNAALMADEEARVKRMVITRGRDAVPHTGRKQRGAEGEGFVQHPAIVRGLGMFRESADTGGAAALTLFSMPTLHVSYAHFKSGYPLPLHSHDADCYYLVIAGSMRVGSKLLEKGDGVLIPGACLTRSTRARRGSSSSRCERRPITTRIIVPRPMHTGTGWRGSGRSARTSGRRRNRPMGCLRARRRSGPCSRRRSR